MTRHANRHATRSRRHVVRSEIPDGEEIRRLRIEKSLTQEGLEQAIAALSDSAETVGVRTIRKAERGVERRSLETLGLIARTLGCPLEQIVKTRMDVRWAMMDEVVSAAQTALPHDEARVFVQAFRALERVPAAQSVERELLLAIAVRRDVMGDTEGALRIGRLLLAEPMADTSEFFVRTSVRVASFFDHAGEHARGLALLDPILARISSKPHLADEEWWAQYQAGTLLARAGNVRRARTLLRRVRSRASTLALRTAALHQLGVIDQRRGKFDDATTKFRACLEERRQESPDDFRLAYEYRRLREIAAATGDSQTADTYLSEANDILRRWSFARFTRKLATTAKGLRRK